MILLFGLALHVPSEQTFREYLNDDPNNFSSNFYNYPRNSNEELNPCGNPKVALSPDGNNLVLWQPENESFPFFINARRTGKSIILVDGDCLKASDYFANCIRNSIGTPNNGITHLYWSTDSKNIFFIDFPLNLRQAQLSESRDKFLMSPPVKLDENWQYRDSLTVLGATKNSDLVAEVSRLRLALQIAKSAPRVSANISRYDDYRVTLINSGFAGSVARNTSDQNLVLINETNNGTFHSDYLADELVAASSRMLRANQIGYAATDVRGNRYVVGGSSVLRLENRFDGSKKLKSAIIRNESGIRPIIDSRSGELLGVFSEKSIAGVTAHSLNQALLDTIRANISDNETLDDIQFSTDQKVAFVISHNISQGAYFRYFNQNSGQSTIHVSTKFCPSEKALSDTSIRLLNVGTRQWPLFTRLYQREHSRHLVVWLHGGPLSDISRDSQWDHGIRDMLRRGADVLMVGYSGTLDNAEIASRLRRSGGVALERDADILSNYLRRQELTYDQISIVAESFGGAVAPPLIARSNDFVSKVVLISPLAKLKPPPVPDYNQVPQLKGMLRARHERDMLWYRRTFASQEGGTTKPFADWLHDQYLNIEFGENTLIIQGHDDLRSLPDDIPRLGKANRIVNRLGHAGIGSYLKENSPVTEWLFGTIND